MAAEIDWTRLAAELGVAVIGGVGSAFFTVWKWGRSGAKAEQSVKEDYDGKIDKLREETRAAMQKYEDNATARNDLFVAQTRETLEGIRRQIDQNLLDVERRFLSKPEFDKFHAEYRRDQERTDDKLDRLLEMRQ